MSPEGGYSKEKITANVCRYSTTVSISVSQTEDGGSTPLICSKDKQALLILTLILSNPQFKPVYLTILNMRFHSGCYLVFIVSSDASLSNRILIIAEEYIGSCILYTNHLCKGKKTHFCYNSLRYRDYFLGRIRW